MANGITSTIGLDMGDRYTHYCVLDQDTGDELGNGRVRTTPQHLESLLSGHPEARIALEAGTHSRWASQIAQGCCEEVFVANPRKLRFIYRNDRKSDRVDARALARVARADTELLSPIQHRGEEVHRDLALLRARATLVQARTKLVNALRGLLKATGFRLPALSTPRIGHRTLALVPIELHELAQPLLLAIEGLSDEITTYDKRIEALADETYTETKVLAQVHGVGKLTALAFVLTLESPERFRSSRTVGAYLGLVPRRDQSGSVEKQLSITKAGDAMMRTLLVQCAHRVLAKNAPDSDLRRAGLRVASGGGSTAKRKAVIAVARKLSVLLHALWRSGEIYEPLKNHASAS